MVNGSVVGFVGFVLGVGKAFFDDRCQRFQQYAVSVEFNFGERFG